MEKEIFSSNEQMRRAGEKRYGKGIIKITDENIYINFKKTFGKPQTFTIPRDQVDKVEFMKRELPVKIVGPGFPIGSEQTWYTMDIKLKDREGFNIYIGELWKMTKDYQDKHLEKYRKIQEILTSSS